MLRAVRVMALGFIAIEASTLTLNVRPAFAQSDDSSIGASLIVRYSGYYAPYAIQAAAAYGSIGELDTRKTPPAPKGTDVSYVVQNMFQGEGFGSSAEEIFGSSVDVIRKRAEEALGPWQYQFGSEAYLSCYDKTDIDCQRDLPRWRYHRQRGGPAFQVWTHTDSPLFPLFESGSCDEVSIAFRGTVGSHKSDWVSNLHPVTGYFIDDHYRQLLRNINGIIKKITTLDCYKRASSAPVIVSVGHSLGGGLAQLAALANKPTEPRIEKVLAFDPSPVTGADLVDQKTLDANSKGLIIDRFYQYGEVLSAPRKLVQGYPPANNPCDPLVRTVHFDALKGGPVELHGMAPLAAHLVQLSYQGGDTHVKPHSSSCDTRYDHPNPAGEKAMPVADLLRTILTPAQTQAADLGVPPALYVPPQTQLADLGARRDRYAPPHPQVVDLRVLQALFARPRVASQHSPINTVRHIRLE
jgi:pimeloyl-ACP methyl ester carboxylesterase